MITFTVGGRCLFCRVHAPRPVVEQMDELEATVRTPSSTAPDAAPRPRATRGPQREESTKIGNNFCSPIIHAPTNRSSGGLCADPTARLEAPTKQLLPAASSPASPTPLTLTTPPTTNVKSKFTEATADDVGDATNAVVVNASVVVDVVVGVTNDADAVAGISLQHVGGST